MRHHIQALFTLDPAGRMVRVNEPEGTAAPRFFLGRTSTGNEWRFRDDVSADLVTQLEAACLGERPGELFLDAPHGADQYEPLLAAAAPVTRRWAGPAFRFPDATFSKTGVVLISEKNADLLQAHLPEWRDGIGLRRPFLAMIVDGAAVAVCCSVRSTAIAHEAGVETAEAFRGKGYGALLVGAWAEAVRDRDCIPLYSTSWENEASRALAAKLSLVRYGADLHFR